jgi:hypothetical protein
VAQTEKLLAAKNWSWFFVCDCSLSVTSIWKFFRRSTGNKSKFAVIESFKYTLRLLQLLMINIPVILAYIGVGDSAYFTTQRLWRI